MGEDMAFSLQLDEAALRRAVTMLMLPGARLSVAWFGRVA